MSESYYDILGITEEATPKEIKAAYRKRAKESHPDRGGSTQEFLRVNKAWEVLKDVKKRKVYRRSYKFVLHDEEQGIIVIRANTQDHVLLNATATCHYCQGKSSSSSWTNYCGSCNGNGYTPIDQLLQEGEYISIYTKAGQPLNVNFKRTCPHCKGEGCRECAREGYIEQDIDLWMFNAHVVGSIDAFSDDPQWDARYWGFKLKREKAR